MYFSHEADHKGRRLAFLQGVDLNLDKFSLSTEDHWHLSGVSLADQARALFYRLDIPLEELNSKISTNEEPES